VGDADRGFGRDQPGGWGYNILPFLEYQHVHAMPHDGDRATITALQRSRALAATQVPVAPYICPSRRNLQLYPLGATALAVNGGTQAKNADGGASDNGNKCDYAANTGEYLISWTPGPESLTDTTAFTDMSLNNGIVFQRSMVRIKQITDGTTHTLLVGEKYLMPERYEDGQDNADDQSAFSGDDVDQVRAAYFWPHDYLPRQDQSGSSSPIEFGSAHAGAMNAVFCDGSVTTISYEIDGLTFRRLCNRHDGQ
jgi:prepilin-type processing-associated H-X9-DG protein